MAIPRNELNEGVAIDSTGELLSLTITGDRDVAVHVRGTASADYQIDVGVPRDDGTTYWVSPSDRAYTGVTDIDETFAHPEAKLRLRVTTAAAAGETADVYVAAV